MEILDLMISQVNQQLSQRGLYLDVDEKIKEWILEHYYQPAYGARPMRRAVQKVIEEPLAEEFIKGRFTEPGRIKVSIENGITVFHAEEESLVETG
jgi:ATP-dependent Clp protease ATP-binding subunit ClpC